MGNSFAKLSHYFGFCNLNKGIYLSFVIAIAVLVVGGIVLDLDYIPHWKTFRSGF